MKGYYGEEGYFQVKKVLNSESINFLENSSFEQQLLQLASWLSIPRLKLFEKDIFELFSQESFDMLMKIFTDLLSWIETAVFIFRFFDSDNDIEWAYQTKDLLNDIEKEIRDASLVFEKFMDKSFDFNSLNFSDFDVLNLNIKRQEISEGWEFVKKLLGSVKYHIEVSKEWIDCIEILNQINQELKKCEVLVFEVKERSHYIPSVSEQFIELASLESFVKDVFDDEKIEALEEINSMDIVTKWNRNCQHFISQVYQKIKPLETSLAFFKLRIEYFKERALELFPAAIYNIEQRRLDLEIKCKKLQDDFFSVKKKFQEDKWLYVFSQINKQATNIMDSLELEIEKFNASSLTKKVTESYKTYKVKRDSYVIIRIITFMEWGIWNKLTNNTQVIEGYNALCERWKNLNKDIIKIDNIVRKDDNFFKISENNTQFVDNSGSQESKSVKLSKTPKTPQFSTKYYSLIPVSKNKHRPSLYDVLKMKSDAQSKSEISYHSTASSKRSSISSFVEDTPIQLSKLKIFPAIMEKTGMNKRFASHLIQKSASAKKGSSGFRTQDFESNISGTSCPLRHMASTGQITYRGSEVKLMKYKDISSFSSIPRLSSQKISCFSTLKNQSPSMKMISSQKTSCPGH
ncbi:hypothetical protein PCANB_001333 [Pneumocystis canis]|nr:hypothetical protein PCANB_001333 [Pneumocystis canis]